MQGLEREGGWQARDEVKDGVDKVRTDARKNRQHKVRTAAQARAAASSRKPADAQKNV